MVTQQRLKELFEYRPNTGDLVRKVRVRSFRPGEVAGSLHKSGYLQVKIDGEIYPLHRLVWLYVHGDMPSGMIDHINRDKLDNRIENLRAVTRKQNMENTAMYAHNTSGYKGVSWISTRGHWVAQIKHNNRLIRLGQFNNPEDAHDAYLAARRRLFTHYEPDAPTVKDDS